MISLILGSMMAMPSVTPFYRGLPCAFSMEFDDSMTSQVKNLLPLLAKYNFTATFYVNPDTDRYKVNKTVWEKDVLAAGHELGNHTMRHKDTVGAIAAESEIGDAATILHKIIGRPSLIPFAVPGGVKWDIPATDFNRILTAHNLIFPPREDFYQDGHGDILRLPRLALESSSWHRLGFHGVGGEWLSTSVENITTLLQFLDANRAKMWVAPTGVVWKYQREREAFVGFTTSREVMKPQFDQAKLAPFELYDVPLSFRVPIDAGWKKAVVTVDGHRATTVAVVDGMVEFEATPQAKSVRVEKG